MNQRPRWLQVARPLVFPLILVACLAGLTQYLDAASRFDSAISSAVGVLPRSLTPAFNFIAAVGSVPVLILVAVLVAAYEFVHKHYVRGGVMLASLVSLVAFISLKYAVGRARPVTEFVKSHGLHDFSFPSGHATGSSAVYGMMALLIWNNSKKLSARTASGLLVALIALIGLSRVYLGAHFPTDVLGGWIVGLIIISILRSISLAMAKRSDRPTAVALEDTTEATG